jgi:hypothetical protein
MPNLSNAGGYRTIVVDAILIIVNAILPFPPIVYLRSCSDVTQKQQ